MRTTTCLSLLVLAGCIPLHATAQKSAAEGIAEYRALLQDGNPAELFEAKGEDLWKQKRGPKAASMEKCDLGKGPGVVKGAFAELPRYFPDTGRVQDLPQSHASERRAYEVGKRLFFLRAGPHDFACATCHGADGKRIRLQDLPNLTKNPGAGEGFGAWPAYRVSSGELWGMQRRLNDCFRQQRFPYPGYASDVTVALAVYMGVNGKGGKTTAPAIKR